jgi:uncharacterized protein YabN with tetrapyrrole methylase and pyrophosphatase domain
MQKDKYNLLNELACFQKEIAKSGFDWVSPLDVIEKLLEEVGELKEAFLKGEGEDRIKEEYGDVLYAALNLSNHLNCLPELVLKAAHEKFKKRFNAMLSLSKKRGLCFSDLSLKEQEILWQKIKEEENAESLSSLP